MAQIWLMLLLWNERVLVTYFKKMNALFETDGNGRCMPAVAVSTLQGYLISRLLLYPDIQERRGTMALAWFPGALFMQGTLLGLAQLLSEWHGWLVSRRVAEWHWALFPLKCHA